LSADEARNRAFFDEWESAGKGRRRPVAEKYGMTYQSACVIAHRLRVYGKTSPPPSLDTDA
jgi:hypothetical protein